MPDRVSANGPSNDASFIDLESLQVVKKVVVGKGPWGAIYVERPGG
jgi:YVTN family beta-propeller protein